MTLSPVIFSGGTADISVFEKRADDTLKQIHRASGGPWGGIYVDEAFLNTLIDIFGVRAIESLKAEDMEEYLYLMRDFEVKKRAFHLDDDDDIIIRVSSLLKKRSEQFTGHSLARKLKELKYEPHVTICKSADKLRIHRSFARKWFEQPLSKLVSHLKTVLAQENMQSVKNILLVGGFGESEYVQKTLELELVGRCIVVPSQAGLVVLKGAVRFGHESNIISSRIMKESYGMRVRKKCVPFQHIGIEKKMVNNELYVENVFLPFVAADEKVETNTGSLYEDLKPTDLLSTGISLFKTPNKDTEYTCDKACVEIGKLRIYHPEGATLEDKKMDVSFVFGGTELTVRARLQKFNKEATVKLDFLE